MFWNENQLKQARKGFRPISAIKGFEKPCIMVLFSKILNDWNLSTLKYFVVSIWTFICLPFDILLFLFTFKYSFVYYWIFFCSHLEVSVNCILTQNCKCNKKWCNFWLKERQQDRTTNQILRSALARSRLKISEL